MYATLKTHKEPMKPRFIVGGRSNTLEAANVWLHRILWTLKPELDDIHCETTAHIEATELQGRFARPVASSMIVNTSGNVVARVRAL